MRVETIIETPEGMRIASITSDMFDSVIDAVNDMSKRISDGGSKTIKHDEQVLLLPNELLRRSVIKFRDATDDPSIPF